MEARWNDEDSNIIMTGETFFVNIFFAYGAIIMRTTAACLGRGGGGCPGILTKIQGFLSTCPGIGPL